MKINKFVEHSKEEKLQEYLDGKLNLTPILNILMNDRKTDWYSRIGEYFLEKMGKDFFGEEHSFLFDKMNGSKKDKESSLRMLGIYFITTYLDEKSLKKMFGNPICHDHFGEGFERKRKYSFCSHIVEIDGQTLHIGYDHRGTVIECEKMTSENVLNIIRKLIDLYKEI